MADKKIADDEALLMRHLVRLVKEHHQVIDSELANMIHLDPAEVWRRVAAESGNLSDILERCAPSGLRGWSRQRWRASNDPRASGSVLSQA